MTRSTGVSHAGPDRVGIDEVADGWARAVAAASHVPVRVTELRQLLSGYAARLIQPGTDAAGRSDAAREIGQALIAADFTNVAALEATLNSLAGWLTDAPPDSAAPLAALAAGYAQALRERTQVELESIIRAVLTARRLAEQARVASEARFGALFVSSASGICVVGPDDRVVEVNPALAVMLDRPFSALHQRRLTDFARPERSGAVADALAEVRSGRRTHVELDAAFARPDNRTVWLRLSLAPVLGGDRDYLVVTVQDDTERHHLQAALSHQALHDPLTDLPNRALVLQRLTDLVAANDRTRQVGVCYLDLDGFKAVNDSFGHGTGDEVLRVVAQRLSRCVTGRGWLAGRLSGDEFVIIADGLTGTRDLAGLAEAVVSAIREPIAVQGQRLAVSASVGATDDRIPHGQPSDLLRAADTALYWAKAAGGDRYDIYDPSRHDAQALRTALGSELRAALHRDDFTVEYQPIVRFRDGATVGAEALLRWSHPQYGPVSPEVFIDLAEELGLIGQLGRWVLERGVAQAASWHREFGEAAPFVSVNLSARQLHDTSLADELLRTLDEVHLPAHRLQLELTESALLGPAQGPADALEVLARRGVRIAVDDFGTGYSNLAYLRRLPVHELKIAGAFVEGLAPGRPGTPADRQIVASVIALAHGLNLTVTAEGVETSDQARLLRAMGCDHAQGWWFARPGDAGAVTRIVAGHQRAATGCPALG